MRGSSQIERIISGVDSESVADDSLRLCQDVAWWLRIKVSDVRASMEDWAIRFGHRNRLGVVTHDTSKASLNEIIMII